MFPRIFIENYIVLFTQCKNGFIKYTQNKTIKKID